ncbi:MAG: PKD domain-containing protein [Candidatus Bipolaricaulota bacterium]|nr:PKD domain-containing protein [Candidatus Bipolaricaulota bacterium]
MRVRVALIVILALLGGVWGAVAQQYAAEILAPPPRTASPNDFVTLVFVVSNRGSVSDTYEIRVETPERLQIVGAPSTTLTLAPGAQEPLFVTLFIPNDAPAGDYFISVEARSQNDPRVQARARAQLTVVATTGIAIRAPDPKEVEPGTEVFLSFTVINRGNVLESVRVEATTRSGYPTSVDPALLELLPGASKSVLVSVRVPADAAPGFEPVTLTASSLAREGVGGSATATLTVLPPLPKNVPTELFLRAPAELSVGANLDLPSASLTPFISLYTAATLPDDQRFALTLRLSEGIYWQILDFLPVSVTDFLFESEVRGFFVRLGDLRELPLQMLSLPRRGVELGARDGFSLLVTFNSQTPSQRLVSLNFLGPFRAGVLGLQSPGSTPYSLMGAYFRGSFLIVESGISQSALGTRRMVFIRAIPSFYGIIAGFEFLRVEPGFPTLTVPPATFTDAQSLSIFGGGGLGPLSVASVITSSFNDLFNDPNIQEIVKVSAQARATLSPLFPGLPYMTYDARFYYDRSNDPPFPPLSTDRIFHMVSLSELSGRIGYILNFIDSTFIDNLLNVQTKTLEVRKLVFVRRFLTDGGSASLSIRWSRSFDPNTNITFTEERDILLRIVFATRQFSVSMVAGLSDNSGLYGSLDFTLHGPMTVSFLMTFAEPTSLGVSVQVTTRFALPFESVFVKGRIEGYLFIDLNNNSKRDPGEPGIAQALLTLDGQLARTDETGYFRFPPVAPGSYKIEISRMPVGYSPTVTLPIAVTLGVNQIVTVEIPVRPVATVRGRVFDDKNRNGRLDPDEPGLRGVRLLAVGPKSFEARTAEDGQYLLQLEPGTYTISMDRTTLPRRYEPTTPQSVPVTLQTGQVVTIDFGAAEAPRPILFAPNAEFSYSPAQPRAGERVTFDASASSDSDGQIVLYEWDFDGDGKTDATGKIVEHIFKSAGTYSVTLTVTDNDGLKDTETKTISVRP